MIFVFKKKTMLRVESALEEGHTTVSMEISATHVKPTAVGKDIVEKVSVESVQDKFFKKIAAYEEGTLLGETTHKRAIVNRDQILAKL